jgi:hypothetical protein
MTSRTLHMQWPMTFQSHGSFLKENNFFVTDKIRAQDKSLKYVDRCPKLRPLVNFMTLNICSRTKKWGEKMHFCLRIAATYYVRLKNYNIGFEGEKKRSFFR